MIHIKDQLGNSIVLDRTPQRIVSLVPSQTELLIDLGLESQLLGITKFCVHPGHLRKTKTIVGGTKTIRIDVIKALKPDIILCNKEENTQEIVESCQKLCPVHVSDIVTIEDNNEMMFQYGMLFKKEKETRVLIDEINLGIKKLRTIVSKVDKKRVTYFIWQKPYMVVGNDTFINTLLEISGYENAYKNAERYPEITLESLQDKTDYIFLSSEPFPFKEEHKTRFENFVGRENVILVDGEYFSWYGSRLIGATKYFENLFRQLV